MEPKLTSDSYSETTNMVLPNDANTMGNLFGGQLLKWLDMSCAISAHRHSKQVAVTAAVNNVSFDVPIKLGDLVTIKAHVSRTFNTSMEVWADVWIESSDGRDDQVQQRHLHLRGTHPGRQAYTGTCSDPGY